MTSFQADVSVEYVFDSAIQKRTARKSSQKNKYVALIRDDFDHVLLSVCASATGKSSTRKTFPLERNIEKIFYKNADDAKITLQLKKPKCFIFIGPSTEQLRVDSDAGKEATPKQNVAQIKSLARKLLKIQKNPNTESLLLTLSDDERSI